MTYVRLANGKLRGEDGVPFSWDESNPRFPAFIQWLENGGTLEEAVEEPVSQEVPAEIQMWQAKTVLLRVGLLGQIEQAVKTASNPEIEIAWEYAPNVVRRSAFVNAMAAALNLDDATIDNLFIEGAKIK